MPFLVTDPTALQPMLNCVALHDTLENWLLLPDGTAADCTAQFDPFHRSASGTSLVPLKKAPTPVQAFEAVQDTPLSRTSLPPAGEGTLCIDQFVPFHTSPQVWVVLVPTASHEVEDVQDTELSWVAGSTGGLGVFLTTQLVPFQCSANGVWLPEPSVKNPTAMHDFVDGHETAVRKLCTAPAGLGVDWTTQLVPFQCSASVESVPPPASTSPTAVHTFAPLQDTASRLLFEALGVLVMNQELPLKISTSASNTPPVGSSPPPRAGTTATVSIA
jgi:hypothetical protein